MANRSALRTLQARLAERLQAARREGVAVASWLAVEFSGRQCLLPLAQSGEIFPWSGVQTVPYTQPWFLGVANLRGVLVGVVDISLLLGESATRSPQALVESSLIAFHPGLDMNVALLADRLAGLRSPGDFSSSEPPAETDPPFFGTLYTDNQGARWQELNLQALSRLPGFLGISV